MSEVASKEDRSDIDIDAFRQKVDRMEDSLASAGSDSGFDSRKPLRTPYQSDDSSFSGSDSKNAFKSDFGSGGNTFDRGLTAAKKEANQFNSGLSDAQKKFNEALAGVKKPNADGTFGSPSELLSTKPANDFKQALADTNAQLQSGLRSGIDAAKKNVGFDQSLAKVNQSLYDMNGQLTTGASRASKSVGDSVEAARQRFNSALGTVSDKAIEAAKSSKEFGGDLKDKIVAAASEFKPPLRGQDNSFKPAFSHAVDPVKAEAQNLLDKAKTKSGRIGLGI